MRKLCGSIYLLTLLFQPFAKGEERASTSARCQKCLEAMSREERGFRNNLHDASLLRLRDYYKKPEADDDFQINPYLLLGAVRVIVARDRELQGGGVSLTGNVGRAAPLEAFVSLERQLNGIFLKRLELSEKEAAALAEIVLVETLAVSGIKPGAFSKAVGRSLSTAAELSALAKSSAEKLWLSSTIESGYDVPFFAGYAADDPKFIFIDKNVPATGKAKGKLIRAHFYLNFHERVEKILLDELGLTYQHAHQIAQRTERRVAMSDGVGWSLYSGWLAKLEEEEDEDRKLRIHPKLDMTCYYSYDDKENLELIEEMEESKRQERLLIDRL